MKNKIKRVLQFSVFDVYKFLRDRKKIKKRNKQDNLIKDNYFNSNEVQKLHIGCGSNILDGWLNTDINCKGEVVYLDAGKLFPFKDKSFHFIFSEHLFEHLTVEEQINMLSESFRTLKKGGVLRVATPSLNFLIELYCNPHLEIHREYLTWALNNIPRLSYVNNKIDVQSEKHIYVINNFFKAWGHQLIHDFSSLSKLGDNVGFRKFKKVEVGKSDYSSLQNIERHGTIIPPEFNKLETMVIEFIK